MNDESVSVTQSQWRRVVEWLLYTRVRDPALARHSRLAAAMLLVGGITALIGLGLGIVFWLSSSRLPAWRPYLIGAGVFMVLLAVIYLINRLVSTPLAGLLLAVLLLAGDLLLLVVSGPASPVSVALIVPVIVAGLFSTPVSAVVVAAVAAVAYLLLNLRADPAYLTHLVQGEAALQTGLMYLNLFFVSIVSWQFARTARQAFKESQQLSLALVEQREELEGRLEAQTRQLQATVSVARAVAGTRNLDKLLEDVVRLVRETFGYYHVQVFMVDEDRQYAVLRQSTGEVGQRLLASGHRLPVGSLSVIGQVTASGRAVVARDTDTDAVHRRNELLPNTRSEMAVPLSVGDRVIGALDLQSVEPDAFPEQVIPTLQALADQIAVAIENARLFEQAEQNLRELRELSHEVTQRSWSEFLAEAREEEIHQSYGPETKAIEIFRSRVIERVLTSGTVIVSTGKDGRQAFVAAPIVVRNEVIGVLGVEPDGVREWSQDDLLLIQGIADRTALAVENARLYLQARRAAERERLVSSIAERLQRAPSLALLLESATRELAEALGTESVYAEINVERPLARARKEVSEEPEVVEAESRQSAEDAVAPDEPEEARAES